MKRYLPIIIAVVLAGCTSLKPEPVTDQFLGGIGAILREAEGITVIDVAIDYPADKAGIAAGDKIIKIDEFPALGLGLREIIILIRGPVGTKVTLIVQSPNSQPRAVVLTRERIKPKKMKLRGE